MKLLERARLALLFGGTPLPARNNETRKAVWQFSQWGGQGNHRIRQYYSMISTTYQISAHELPR